MAWACCAPGSGRALSPSRPRGSRTPTSSTRPRRNRAGRSRRRSWRGACAPSTPGRWPRRTLRVSASASTPPPRWRSPTAPRRAPCWRPRAKASTWPAAKAPCACSGCSARAARRSPPPTISTPAATSPSADSALRARFYNARMKTPAGTDTRVAAARVLDGVLHRGRSLRAELAAVLPKISDPRDRALVEAICFAALRNRSRYDDALTAWMPRPLPPRERVLRALLHAGFAQLDPLQLPAHAALAATVEAARARGRPRQAGLVNALLRRAQRDGLPPADPAAAWPDWLLARLRADWPDDVDAILAASAEPGPMWLRVNRRQGSRDEYL